MVRGRGKAVPQKEVLSVSERASLEQEKRDLEALKKEKTSMGTGTSADKVDIVNIEKQIRHIDEAIHSRTAPKLTGIQKDSLVKEEEMLVRELQENLPTRDEMDHPSKNPGAIRKHMRWLERNKGNIKRFRYIQRVLRPDDPRSYENLRREK